MMFFFALPKPYTLIIFFRAGQGLAFIHNSEPPRQAENADAVFCLKTKRKKQTKKRREENEEDRREKRDRKSAKQEIVTHLVVLAVYITTSPSSPLEGDVRKFAQEAKAQTEREPPYRDSSLLLLFLFLLSLSFSSFLLFLPFSAD